MPHVKVIFDRETCIGAKACVSACPKFWEMAADDKANLLGSKKNNETGKYELEVEASEQDFTCLRDSAAACPVQVIELSGE